MEPNALLDRLWEFWTTGRRQEIVPLIEGQGDAEDVLKLYLTLQGGLFWQRRDLAAVLAVSRWGIEFARRHHNLEAENVLLYNVSTFTLPWWSDSLPTTPGQREQGRNAAQRLVGLREHMGKRADDLSMAQWVCGAHAMFSGDLDEAAEAFLAAVEEAKVVGDKGLEACAVEGMGRAVTLLDPMVRDEGLETLDQADQLYREAGEKYEYHRNELARFRTRLGVFQRAVNPDDS